MNKLYLGLIRNSFAIGRKHIAPNNSFLYSTSRYSKPNKPTKSQQSANKQLLKATSTNPLNPNKSSKSTMPQYPSQKKGSLLTEQQKKQLAFQQKLQACYTQIQSFPTDSYETVVQNFKRVKARLNDRKVYVPNKPQLLAQMDSNMELIKKHHNVWRSPSTQTQRALTDTKKEIIEYQLEQAKKKYYLSLLDDQRALIGAAAAVMLIMGCFQYYSFIKEEQDPNMELPKMFL